MPFILPSSPAHVELKDAIRASLAVLDLAPDRVTVPTLGAVWRSILGAADFSVFVYGATGRFKTALASLLQQHFGAGSRYIPVAHHINAIAPCRRNSRKLRVSSVAQCAIAIKRQLDNRAARVRQLQDRIAKPIAFCKSSAECLHHSRGCISELYMDVWCEARQWITRYPDIGKRRKRNGKG